MVAYASNIEELRLIMILAVQYWLLINRLLIKKCVFIWMQYLRRASKGVLENIYQKSFRKYPEKNMCLTFVIPE